MKMKNAFFLLFLTLSFTILHLGAYLPSSQAYWGYGDDCDSHHGIGHHNATYNPNPNITIDGQETEHAWFSDDVTEYLVPVATIFTSSYFFVSYIHVKYIYDDSNIYIRALYNDTTPQNQIDMLLFCWNINWENYSVANFLMENAMETDEGNVDSWGWICGATPNGTQNNGKDQAFGPEGWYDATREDTQIECGYTFGTWINNTNHYLIELKRPLITAEKEVDVQFDHNGFYQLSFSVCDMIASSDHAISWNYEVYFDHLTTEANSIEDNTQKTMKGASLITLTFVLIGTLSIIILKIRNNHPRSFNKAEYESMRLEKP